MQTSVENLPVKVSLDSGTVVPTCALEFNWKTRKSM